MLYSQILAFILIMVVFEAYSPGRPTLSPGEAWLSWLALTAWLWAACRLAVFWFLRRMNSVIPLNQPQMQARRLATILQALALAVQLTMVIGLDLKAHMMGVGLLADSQTLSGGLAALLYLALASLVWSQTYILERATFQNPPGRRAFVLGQVRFVVPVIFPWLLLALVSDGLALLWPGGDAWINTAWGDLAFIILFVFIAAFLFPPLVRGWWGCRELPPGPTRGVAQDVLDHLGVKVAAMLTWPIMGGRVLTAGVVGVWPRFRYLLITPALSEALNQEELAAVVAHEAGHVKKAHMVKFLALFIGFFAVAYALAEPLELLLRLGVYWVAGTGWGSSALMDENSGGFFSLAMAVPMALIMILYLRFAVGYFMRNYERQADFFALAAMRSAGPLISSLERIAIMAGNIRDVPSWHHFSVAQRVRALYRAEQDPNLIAAHDRRMRRALAAYFLILALAVGAGHLLGSAGLGRDLGRMTIDRLIEQRLSAEPDNHRLLMQRGILRFETGREAEALADLLLAARRAPRDPEVLNALAWLLATAKDRSLRSPGRAVQLAQAAVSISPAPHIWDTLAEALFADGRPKKALAAARSALAAGPRDRRDYYQAQLRRFQEAVDKQKKP